jgi:hypothetical protein
MCDTYYFKKQSEKPLSLCSRSTERRIATGDVVEELV